MSSTTCNFDDASLVTDELVMIETTESDSIVVVEEDEDEEGSLEGAGKIQQTFDSMMCDTPSVLDGVYHPTTVPGMIETTESDSIVVEEEDEEEEEDRTKATETVSSNDGQNPEEESKVEEREDESLEDAGKLIRDLLHCDIAKVNAALEALNLDSMEDKRKCDSLVTAGGCFALVYLMKHCLEKAIARIPACDQVTELNALAELMTLHKTLHVILILTFQHDLALLLMVAWKQLSR
jgi:hypothetical protein